MTIALRATGALVDCPSAALVVVQTSFLASKREGISKRRHPCATKDYHLCNIVPPAIGVCHDAHQLWRGHFGRCHHLLPKRRVVDKTRSKTIFLGAAVATVLQPTSVLARINGPSLTTNIFDTSFPASVDFRAAVIDIADGNLSNILAFTLVVMLDCAKVIDGQHIQGSHMPQVCVQRF